MAKIFLDALNLSVTAGWIVLAIILIRLLLKKAPKWLNCLLWGIVGIRLIFPFSLESVLSFIPSKQTFPDELITTTNSYYHTIDSGVDAVDRVITPALRDTSPSALESIILWASYIWLAGIAVMLIYTALSYILLKRKVRTATLLYDNIKQSEAVISPFILGFIRPKIYLPYSLKEKNLELVLAHEKAHLKRFDHLIKPIAFLILSVYWFNPLLWVAYILLCRDIELACDERVVKTMEREERQAYSKALLDNSINRRLLSACPLAFGEVGVKARIKRVMSYKKPAFWIIIAGLAISVIAAVCLLTNPPKAQNSDYMGTDGYTDCEGVDIVITDMQLNSDEPYITVEIVNENGKEITFGEEFHIYRKSYLGRKDCCGDNHYWHLIARVIKGKRESRKFNLKGFELDSFGTYQLEFKFTIRGEEKKKYTATAEFARLNSKTLNGKYDTKEVVYQDEELSTTASERFFPVFEFAGNTLFVIEHYGLNSSVTSNIGNLKRIDLYNEDFETLFKKPEAFTIYDTEKFMENNDSAWIVRHNRDKLSADYLYILRQKDGKLFICYAFENGGERSVNYMLWLKNAEEIFATESDYSTETVWVGYNGEAKDILFGMAANKLSMYTSSQEHCPLIEINSLGALNSFKKEFSELLGLDKALYGSKSFNNAVSDCDEEFFEINTLFLTYITAASTDYRYESTGLYCDGKDLLIKFIRKSSPVGDTAMSGWFGVTKINRQLVKDCERFNATLAYNLTYNTYEYVNTATKDKAILVINEDKTFQFNYSYLSSYIVRGNYEIEENEIVLVDNQKNQKFCFEIVGNALMFLEEKSAKLPEFKYSADKAPSSPVPDKSMFSGAGF